MSETEAIKIKKTPAGTVQEEVAAPKKHIGVHAYIGTFGTSVFIQSCTIIQGILIARLLGPLGRGEYAAVILWPNVFAAIGIFGSNIAIARTSAKEPDLGAVIRASLILSFLTSSLAGIACYMSLPYLIPATQTNIVSIAKHFVLFIPLNHLSLNLFAIDRGIGDFKRLNYTRPILYVAYLSIIIVLWLSNLSTVFSFAIALLLGNFTVVLVKLILILRKYPLFGKIYSLQQTIKSSFHFGLAGIAMPLYQQADKAILLWLMNVENLGIYVVALSASAAIGSITNSTGIVTFTTAAQAERGEGFERIAKTFRISALLWLIFGGILALAMPLLLPLVYGSEFESAVTPARFLIIGSAFGGLADLLDQNMRGQGRAFVGLGGRIAGLIIMGITGLLLVRYLEINGICLGYIAGQLSCLIVIITRTNEHYKKNVTFENYIPGSSDCSLLINKIKYLTINLIKERAI